MAILKTSLACAALALCLAAAPSFAAPAKAPGGMTTDTNDPGMTHGGGPDMPMMHHRRNVPIMGKHHVAMSCSARAHGMHGSARAHFMHRCTHGMGM